jgi:hypothetical protein
MIDERTFIRFFPTHFGDFFSPHSYTGMHDINIKKLISSGNKYEQWSDSTTLTSNLIQLNGHEGEMLEHFKQQEQGALTPELLEWQTQGEAEGLDWRSWPEGEVRTASTARSRPSRAGLLRDELAAGRSVGEL